MMNETVLDLNPQDLTENQSENGAASQDTEQATTESKKAATKTSTTSKRQAATKKQRLCMYTIPL